MITSVYEYRILHHSDKSLESKINELGAQGFRFVPGNNVFVNYGYLIMEKVPWIDADSFFDVHDAPEDSDSAEDQYDEVALQRMLRSVR